jgi:hypothetical protein
LKRLTVCGLNDHTLHLIRERKLRRLSTPRIKATANPAVSEATARATNRDSIGQEITEGLRYRRRGSCPDQGRFYRRLDFAPG